MMNAFGLRHTYGFNDIQGRIAIFTQITHWYIGNLVTGQFWHIGRSRDTGTCRVLTIYFGKLFLPCLGDEELNQFVGGL